MSQPVSYATPVIAKLLVLTPRRLQQLAKEGHLPKASRGRFELVPTVQAYIKYLRDRSVAGEMQGGESSDKARLVKARADIAEFEAARMAGEQVPVEEVEAAWAELVARFRARMLALPGKAAPMVAIEDVAAVCNDIIETYVHEALAELAATEVSGRAAAGRGDASRAANGGAAFEADDLAVG